MRKIVLLFFILFTIYDLAAQNVGIGTTSPNNKAIIDIHSNSKGVLFPRLTTVQRIAISNPPNGLHVFNTDISSLEFYDSLNNNWVAYSNNIYDTVITTSVNLQNPVCIINYNTAYTIYKITIDSSVKTSLWIMTPPNTVTKPVKVFVFNYGQIIGQGGAGGPGKYTSSCTCFCPPSSNGEEGDPAIAVGPNVTLVVYNYGIVAGGGGGGGGGGSNIGDGSGGGGGGGGQSNPINSAAGIRGTFYTNAVGPCTASTPSSAQNGTGGTYTTIGIGGNGSPGTVFTQGSKGGDGGTWGQPGQNGLGSGGTGGPAGKAIKNFGVGAHSNSILNYGTGIAYGAVD